MRLSKQFEFDPWLESLNVYVVGCRIRCKGCHNPELHSFNSGVDWRRLFPKIEQELEGLKGLIYRVFVWGGEPLDQPIPILKEFLHKIKRHGLEVWLFTGHEREHIPDEILKTSCLDYIKIGPYKSYFRSDDYVRGGLKLATTNQRLYRLVADHILEEVLA